MKLFENVVYSNSHSKLFRRECGICDLVHLLFWILNKLWRLGDP